MKKTYARLGICIAALVLIPASVFAAYNLYTIPFDLTAGKTGTGTVNAQNAHQSYTVHWDKVTQNGSGDNISNVKVTRKAPGAILYTTVSNVDYVFPKSGSEVSKDLGNSGSGTYKYSIKTSNANIKGNIYVADNPS